MLSDPPPADVRPTADGPAEYLLAYQGVVIHDLRGDLNGLLLTIDFLRRQIGGRAELQAQFGETLGDIDRARDGLLRTLNQLEMVGHARRVAGGRGLSEAGEQNLSAVVAEVTKHQLADRARRRQVELVLPEPDGVTVRADGILLRMVVQRLIHALVDLGRNTQLRVTTKRLPAGDAGGEPAGQRVALHVTLADPTQLPPDLSAKLAALVPGQPGPSAIAAIGLAGQLANLLGGGMVAVTPEEGGGFRLELPDGSAEPAVR